METLEIMAGIDAARSLIRDAQRKVCTGTACVYLKLEHAGNYLDQVAKDETVGILSPESEAR